MVQEVKTNWPVSKEVGLVLKASGQTIFGHCAVHTLFYLLVAPVKETFHEGQFCFKS